MSVYKDFTSGNKDAAMAAQTDVNRIIHMLLKYKVIPACKAILEKQGIPVCSASFSQARYTEEEKQVLFEKMLKVGLFLP